MKNDFLAINPEEETLIITNFLNQLFKQQRINRAVIGLSGGIDSATSFSLLNRVVKPEDLFVMHLYYDTAQTSQLESLLKTSKIPEANIKILSIKNSVDAIAGNLALKRDEATKLRHGNIAARVRMIMLFDYAKEKNALVCGTENKSENLLGYFTRFGDQASDIEPIEHLYKTQIIQLATSLGVPDTIIQQQPSAGLWDGQTDEGQFGFTYKEADQVLYLAVEKGLSAEEIAEQGFEHAKDILRWRQQNMFKHLTPYTLDK